MSQSPSWREELVSQIPALRLLMAMGYTYLTPDEALALRGGKKNRVILEGVLEPWLRQHNQVRFKGETYPFSPSNIRQAVEALRDEPLVDGLLATSARVYETLTLGVSLKQTIHGDSKSYSLHYIDWKHPENNVYHVTDEFPVERVGSRETRRPDIVLLVNGIPLVVIECKRPDLAAGSGKAFEEAISQMLRNQGRDEIPNLFVYSQLLLAVSVNDALYATTATPKKFWSVWQEQESRREEISRAEQRVRQIAYDISEHYASNFQGQGYKAQLAVSSKAMALRYKHYLDDFGMLTSEIVISPPDTRQDREEVDQTPALEEFWKGMMARFGSEKAYNQDILADFAREDGVELLIVVDKLLVGFDEPRNTVLYVDKPLKEHGLLQAIARVNRLFEGKEFGYIVDYRGVLGELNEALETYNALEGYDAEDVTGTINDTAAEVAKLPQLHSELWDVFKTVENKKDGEALQRFLAPEDVRQRFYDVLTAFASCLKVALGTVAFYEDTPERQIETYKHDLVFFHNLRVAVKQRYAETIDYKDYERKVRKLLDSHIQSSDVLAVTEQVNIFDVQAFEAEVERIVGAVAQADTIAHRLKRTITEYLERDPAFYQKFSRLIDETIRAYREGRISEAEYLQKTIEIQHTVQAGRDDAAPSKLYPYRDASAYYGVIRESLVQYSVSTVPDMEDLTADVAIRLEQIIEERKIRDWATSRDVQNDIKLALEDYLYSIKGRYDIPLTGGDLDVILDQVLEVARQRDRM